MNYLKSTCFAIFKKRNFILNQILNKNFFIFFKFTQFPSSFVTLSSLSSISSHEETLLHQQRRGYAKKNTGKKNSGKKEKLNLKIDLNDENLLEIIDLEKVKNQMNTTINFLKKELHDHLNLRVSLATIGEIKVETEEGKMPLSQLGQIQQKNPQLIIINMVENPQLTNHVKNSILQSGINLTPQIEGTTLYLPIQKITKEHRQKLAKGAKLICDKTKEKLRNIHNNNERELKKHKEGKSEDLVREIKEILVEIMREYGKKVDEILLEKQKEVIDG